MEITRELRDKLAAFRVSEDEVMRLSELPDDALDTVAGGGIKVTGTVTGTTDVVGQCPNPACQGRKLSLIGTETKSVVNGRTVIQYKWILKCESCGYTPE